MIKKQNDQLLASGNAQDAEQKERARRIDFFREWFEGFANKPMEMRSTGQSCLPEEYFMATADFISQKLQLDSESDSVLDVGCDSAMVSRHVAPRCREFMGVDFIPGMLSQVSNKGIRSASGKPVSFAAADGRALPFRPHTFNKIYCSGVIHTLPSLRDGMKMIENLTRVCRPGGMVLLAAVPDAAKHNVACLEVFKRGAMREKIKLVASLITPRWIKNLLLRLGLKTPYPMTLLEYDFEELKKQLEMNGFKCEIINFPERFWSRDFRLTRTNLLIRIPHTVRFSAQTANPETDQQVSVNLV